MPSSDLRAIEAEIDAAFADNGLVTLPYAQSMWTLLSVAEDLYFQTVITPLEAGNLAIYFDGLMNTLTHPLRVCYQRAAKGPFRFRRELVDEHYRLAGEWFDAAEDYDQFCTIFPLYHAKEIELKVENDKIIPSDWSTADLAYEAYDRLIGKRNPEQEESLEPDLIVRELEACMDVSDSGFSVTFTRRLMAQLTLAFQRPLLSRHTLPKDWQFTRFSLAQFRAVFTSLQSMAEAWFMARQRAPADGAAAMAFASAVWTPRRASS